MGTETKSTTNTEVWKVSKPSWTWGKISIQLFTLPEALLTNNIRLRGRGGGQHFKRSGDCWKEDGETTTKPHPGFSLSSLRTSTATESNTEESTSHRSSPEALELQLPVDFDLQSAEEPLASDMNHPISLKETLNNRTRQSSGVSRTRQVSEEETRSFPESPSSLPPPPPFLLNPV